jgi:hypothetical protein
VKNDLSDSKVTIDSHIARIHYINSYRAQTFSKELTSGLKISSEAKSKVPDWGIQSALHSIKVDSGTGLPMVNVLESTLEWT